MSGYSFLVPEETIRPLINAMCDWCAESGMEVEMDHNVDVPLETWIKNGSMVELVFKSEKDAVLFKIRWL